jgi:hypothetical protein
MPHQITLEETSEVLNQRIAEMDPMIHQKLRTGLEFEADLPVVLAENTYIAKNAEITKLLQPYQPGFTPHNSETWDAVENRLEHAKVDLLFDAAELEELYDSLLANWFELDKEPTEWMYADAVINQLIVPKLMEEINSASWAGVRVNPTPGTPGDPEESWNGFAKVIADGITAGSTTPIITGALEENTMEEIVREFCAALPAPYRMAPGTIYMSTTRAIQYAEQYRTNHSYLNEIRADGDRPLYRVDFYNKVIKPMDCMEGSDRIVFNLGNTQNMIIGNRRYRDGRVQSMYPRMRFQVFDRQLKALGEISRFYGFKYWGHVFVNDQV